MRLYSFVNYYLSPLQAGLQTAHCVSEMSRLHGQNVEGSVYLDWASDHKTIIICNGGNSLQLQDLYNALSEFGAIFNLPVVKFHEDEQSLNCALTSVAILVPAKFYDVKFVSAAERSHNPGRMSEVGMCLEEYKDSYDFTDGDGNRTTYWDGSDEFNFIKLLKSFRLA